MTTKDRLLSSLFWLLAGTMYAFALTEGILAATVFAAPRGTLFAFAALFVAGFLVVFFNRVTGLAFLGAALVFAGLAAISLALDGFAADLLLAGEELLGGFSGFLAGQSPYREEYGAALALALSLLTAFLTVLMTRLRFSFPILAVAAVWVFAAPIVNEWGTSPFALTLMMLCFVLLFVKKQNLLALAGDRAGTAFRYSLLLIPLTGAVFALSWALPAPEFSLGGEYGPPDFRVMAERFLEGLRPTSIGTFTTEGAPLGGPVALSDEHVMDVIADEPLYLSGSVRDVYDGYSWSVSDGAKTPMAGDGNAYDVVSYPAALADAQQYYTRYYDMPTRTARIIPGEVRTRLLFSPPYSLTLETERGLGLVAGAYGAIESDSILAEGAGYTQRYIAWDYENPYILALVEGGAAADGVSGLSEEERALLLAVPDTVTDRVRSLAAELGAESATDYGKMTAIAAYLARFPYTLTPDPVPPDVDFVDHFLFSERRGYCVYYATALAVMGRLEGIPTRYVEGYITPDEPEDDGVFVVDGQLAHAWVEAYFDGFGWVGFEATRPYAASLEDQDSGLSGFVEEEETVYEEFAPPVDLSALEAQMAADRLARTLNVVIPTLALLVAALLVAVLLRLRFRLRFERLGRMPKREAAASWFGMVLNQAATYGMPINRQETALAYADRVKGRLKFRDHSIEDLAEIFSRAVYSENEITEKDCAALRDCHRQMLIRMLSRGGRLRRGVERYLLLRY